MKKVISALLLLCLFFGLYAKETNPKPFVIPELKEWKGGNGNFELTSSSKIIIPAENEDVKEIGDLLSKDLSKMYGLLLPVTTGKTQPGDIVLNIKPNKNLGNEGYEMTIGKTAYLTAPTTTGLYWSTRTFLQMADGKDFVNNRFSIPQGCVRDWPDYALRGFMIDAGRKFIPMDFLRDYVDMMSYYKMNFLQVHLNDNGFPKFFNNNWDDTYAAFRMESDKFPGLAAEDGHYTKDEFRDFQKHADSRFVEIMPEIDMPAHTLAFSHYQPELGSKEFGMDHFDLFNDKTYEFADTLLAEYLGGENPVFTGKRFSIGTDEYSNKDSLVTEKFRYFTDRYIKYVESFGKQPHIWGSLTHAKGKTPVQVDNVLMNAWYNGYADPKEMIDLGYHLISIPDGFVYIVPAAGYYYDYLDIKDLYDNWTPANIGEVIFEEKHPQIEGGMFAVWNDHVGNGISTDDIHHRTFPALQTIAAKTWDGKNVTVPFEEFDAKRKDLSEAPGINRMGRRVPAEGENFVEFWSVDEITPNIEYPFENVGYNYRVEFTINGEDETLGTELFSDGKSVFYLSDPISGMLGFSRDGYLNTFPIRVDKGDKMDITIEGDNKSTRLFVDGKMVKELKTQKVWKSEKDSNFYVPTLVFPLHESGDFKSKITNFKASQK